MYIKSTTYNHNTSECILWKIKPNKWIQYHHKSHIKFQWQFRLFRLKLGQVRL